MTNDTETDVAWLSEEDMAVTRSRMPIVYVDAVPVRVDSNGNVTEVGMLLRVAPDGNISRTFISGRVLYGERVRDALLRHCEKTSAPSLFPGSPCRRLRSPLLSISLTRISAAFTTHANTQ